MKWQTGRRGVDGWGRYTRRRKWYRDAELVEVTGSTQTTPSPSPSVTPDFTPETIHTSSSTPTAPPSEAPPDYVETASFRRGARSGDRDGDSLVGGIGRTVRRRGLAGAGGSKRSSRSSIGGDSLIVDEDEDAAIEALRARQADWGIGDDARMGLE